MAKSPKLSIGQIDVADLQPDPEQPRKYFDPQAQQELANSIEVQGLLYPIIYREMTDENGKKELIIVDGQRRWEACQKLGIEKVQAIKFDGDYEAVALIGNIIREDLTAMEQALAVDKLMSKSGDKLTQVELSKMLGKGESTISEILKVAKLPEFIRNKVIDKKEWSRAKLLVLANQPDKKIQKALFKRMVKEVPLTPRERSSNKGKIETTKNQIELLKSKLAKIEDDDKWTSDDKSALKQHLEELNTVITDMLDSL